MSTGPRAAWLAPTPGISRPNLLSSVGNPQIGEGRWQNGIVYRPNRYDTGGSVDPREQVGTGTKSTSAGPDNVTWDPYIIFTQDRVSTLSGDFDGIAALARRDLETQTSHKIEEILWSNTVDSADFGAGHANISLSDATADDNPAATNPGPGFTWTPNGWDATPPVSAFKTMIASLTDALGGARGMIHCERRLLPFLSFYGLTVKEGQRLVTTLGDHIVVPGTGYNGSDPDENASSENYSWIYGTSMVEVLLTEVFTPSVELVGNVNRSTNLFEYRAERMALAHWDRQVHIGIGVCLEDPAGDCSDIGS